MVWRCKSAQSPKDNSRQFRVLAVEPIAVGHQNGFALRHGRFAERYSWSCRQGSGRASAAMSPDASLALGIPLRNAKRLWPVRQNSQRRIYSKNPLQALTQKVFKS